MRRELKSLRKDIVQLSREADIDCSDEPISSEEKSDAGIKEI